MSYRTGPGACTSDARHPCVVCGRPQNAAVRPFCSRRCADVDLHRWFSGAYAVPVRDDGGDAEPSRRHGCDG
jgi:hypothetical protein